MLALSLGTGVELQFHRRSGPLAPPRPIPPRLRAAPRLHGSGRIGEALAVDPGSWSGLPAPEIALHWQRDGVDIPGANQAHFTPVGSDDLARLRCRVTARNALGEASAISNDIIATHPGPTALGGLSDLQFFFGSGDRILNAFPDFTGAALSFSITGDGVSIDPATGLVTIRTDRLAAGLTVTVNARNSGGTASSSFKVTIAAPEAKPVVPALVRAPALTGSGLVGALVSLDPGAWSGDPAPALALQWLRDGVEIAGATGPDYRIGAADDGTRLAARVTATNEAGSVQAEAAALAVAYAAPVASGRIEDQILTLGAGSSLEAAPAFTGAGLAFAIEGADAAIHAATGRISLPADRLRAAETVTVTARNSGGAASLGFALSVVDAAPGLSDAGFADQSFAQGSGPQGFEAAPGFTGANLSFAIVGAVAGVAIDAATGRVSVDTAALLVPSRLTIRASNGGGSAERSLTVAVALGAPALSGLALADQLALIQGAAAAPLAAAPAFSGAVETYAIAGAGVAIDAATGVIRFDTAALQKPQTVTVTASNAAGSVSASFRMAVLLKPLDLADLTLTIQAPDDGSAAWTGSFGADGATWIVDLKEENYPQAITALWWRPTAHVEGSGPGTGYFPMIRHPSVAKRWIARGLKDGSTDGAAAIRGFLWVNDSRAGNPEGYNILGQSRTHHFLYSFDAKTLNPLTEMAFSAPSAGLTQALSLSAKPAFTADPVIAGGPGVGTTLSLTDGVATGQPAPSLTRQWYLDGAAIAGATGASYVPLAAQIGKKLTARTIAANGIGAGPVSSNASNAITVTVAAPVLSGTKIADQLNLVQGSGAATVAAAPAFTGTVAAYAITAGAGVTINATTGVITLAKTALQAVQTVTVRAANDGGYVEASFQMSVVAAQTAPAISGAPVIAGGTAAGSVLTATDAAATGNPAPAITRQWYLAGTAISGATGASLTTAAAQVGKAITVRTIATNAAGSATSAASNAITVTAAQAVTTVSTVAQLQAAMIAAKGGDIIEVTGGTKAGNLTIATAYAKSPRIIVRAQDKANPPVFQGTIQLSAWDGITLSGLHFVNPVADVRDTWAPYAIRMIDNCKNFTIVDCYISDYFGAIDTRDAENAEIAYNTVENYRCDVFRMYQSNINVRVHHNKIWKSNVNLTWQKDANRHPDGCQLACTSSNAPSNGFTFEDNFVQTLQAGSDLHGCFMLSERIAKNGDAFPTYAHKNITVRRNFFQGTNCETIAFGAVQGVTVEQNKMLRAPGSATTDFYTPQVYFIDACPNDNVVIRNNAWPLIGGQTVLKYGPGESDKDSNGVALNSKVTKSGNIDVATGDPAGWADTDVAKGRVGQYAPR